MLRTCALAATLLLALVSGTAGQCLQMNQNTGLYYNLAPLTAPAGQEYSTPSPFGTYYLNVCANVANGIFWESPCGLCDYQGSTGVGCGNGNPPVITWLPYDPDPTMDGITMVYSDGRYCQNVGRDRESYLNFLCNSDVEWQLDGISESQSCIYDVMIQSKWACGAETEEDALNGKPASSGSVGVGWIIMFILCILYFIYVGIGVLVKFKKYEARGMDLVPNIDFWRDIPALIKDGVAFSINKISQNRFCAEHEYGGQE